MSLILSGTETVGANHAKTMAKNISVKYSKKFSSPPTVVASTLQVDPSEFPDTFAVSIIKSDSSGFSARIYRVDNPKSPGWGQDLRLNWIAYKEKA